MSHEDDLKEIEKGCGCRRGKYICGQCISKRKGYLTAIRETKRKDDETDTALEFHDTEMDDVEQEIKGYEEYDG